MSNIAFNSEANKLEYGYNGFDALSTGTYNTQTYGKIHAFTDLTIDYTNDYESPAATGTITIPAGQKLGGEFSSVVVTSGTGVGYLLKKRV
jgi:hypothetical protein